MLLPFSLFFLALVIASIDTQKDSLTTPLNASLFIISVILFGYHHVDVGTDSIHYYQIYQSIKEGDFELNRLLPGFPFVAQLAGGLGLSFSLFNAFLFALFLLPLLVGARILNRDALGSVIFLFLICQPFFWNLGLNIVRQGLAQSFLFFGMALLTQPRFLWAILTFTVAALLHKSIWIFLPALLLWRLPRVFSLAGLLIVALGYGSGGINALANTVSQWQPLSRAQPLLNGMAPRLDWLLFTMLLVGGINFLAQTQWLTNRARDLVSPLNLIATIALLMSPVAFPDRWLYVPWMLSFAVLASLRLERLSDKSRMAITLPLACTGLIFCLAMYTTDGIEALLKLPF